jgi:hypothetical protein
MYISNGTRDANRKTHKLEVHIVKIISGQVPRHKEGVNLVESGFGDHLCGGWLIQF